MNFQRLGIGNTIFLVFNLIAIVVGIILLFVGGPTGGLIFLIIGAAGLAFKKIGLLFGWDQLESNQTRPPGS